MRHDPRTVTVAPFGPPGPAVEPEPIPLPTAAILLVGVATLLSSPRRRG